MSLESRESQAHPAHRYLFPARILNTSAKTEQEIVLERFGKMRKKEERKGWQCDTTVGLRGGP